MFLKPKRKFDEYPEAIELEMKIGNGKTTNYIKDIDPENDSECTHSSLRPLKSKSEISVAEHL